VKKTFAAFNVRQTLQRRANVSAESELLHEITDHQSSAIPFAEILVLPRRTGLKSSESWLPYTMSFEVSYPIKPQPDATDAHGNTVRQDLSASHCASSRVVWL
jgi:hypothetical protein